MFVKYYHIIGFAENQNQPSYLGKTSDLAFKTEPDKSIDTDDGQTTIGSEKLSCSFTLLDRVTEMLPLVKVWLVPVVSYDPSGLSSEILEIRVSSDDYQIEHKSGEFGKTVVNIVMRYPSDVSAPWSYLPDDYFYDYAILIGRISGAYSEEQRIIVKQGGIDAATYEIVPDIVSGLYAIIDVPRVNSEIYHETTLVRSYTQEELFGVVRLDIEVGS